MKPLSLRTLLFGVCLVALVAVGIGLFLPPTMVSNQRLALKVGSCILLAIGIAVWATAIWLGGKRRHALKNS
jgi:ABC-type uncharacterized transport system permease subunit